MSGGVVDISKTIKPQDILYISWVGRLTLKSAYEWAEWHREQSHSAPFFLRKDLRVIIVCTFLA